MRQTIVLLLSSLLCSAGAASGQQPPPIPGETGTVALEGTVDKTSTAANTVVVKATDGVQHLFHWTERTVLHGAVEAKDATARRLKDLKPGTQVVVHYTTEGANKTAVEVDHLGKNGLRGLKGVVTRVDRGAKQISIRLDDGTRETLQLSARSAKDVGHEIGDGAEVIVYYTGAGSKRVAHYFTRTRRE